MNVYEDPNELMHYGVKGMKWGVRRDVELIANHRRNATTAKARSDYSQGKITSTQKKMAIKKAKADRKQYLKDTKKNYESLKSKSEKEKASMNIQKTALKEVPARKLKKGLRAVNDIFTAAQIGSGAYHAAAVAIVCPPLAPAMLAATAGITAGQLGYRQLRKYIGSYIA